MLRDGQRKTRYGKHETRLERYRRFMFRCPPNRTCAVCGDAFTTPSPAALYCSARCKNDAAMALRKKNRPPRPTVVCQCGRGIVVLAATGRTPRHCSAACRQRAYRQRRVTTSEQSASTPPPTAAARCVVAGCG